MDKILLLYRSREIFHYLKNLGKGLVYKNKYILFNAAIIPFLICFSYVEVSSQEALAACPPDNCFSTKVISAEKSGLCIAYSVEVSASQCAHALSHFMVAVPCGKVTKAWNSRGWVMEFNSRDSSTGVTGLKVDNISNFGEDGKAGTFQLTYTICADDESCLKLLESSDYKFAYKASTCVYYETQPNENHSDPLIANISKFDVSCAAKNDGKLTLSVIGGVAPYTYLWSNGSTSMNLTDLPGRKIIQ